MTAPHITDAELLELKRLEAAATPGPWSREKPPTIASGPAAGWPSGVAVAGTPGRQTIYAGASRGQYPSSDCDLIVAARNALPRLLAEIERLRAELRKEADRG